MKITIELEDCEQYGLAPSFVYSKLTREYYGRLSRTHKKDFWGLQHACDLAARELYAQIVKRRSNVKNLILTYKDAENCYEIYRAFADVWIRKVSESVDSSTITLMC